MNPSEPLITPGVTHITDRGEIIAIIVTAEFSRPGVSFVTPPAFSQQLAFISHPQGQVIEPHLHNPVHREVTQTNEVLVLRKGRLRVDFYDDDRRYLESCILQQGDTILLIKGAHGFEALEEVEMIEVKQGPFEGARDKTRFPAREKQLKYHGTK